MCTESGVLTDGYRGEVRRYFWRNYLSLSIEGGIYMGGIAFVMPQTILPRMIETLGGAEWLIAAVPLLVQTGILGPQIFITHRIERLKAMKPLCMTMGVFQRLPYLFAGLALLFMARTSPLSAMAVVVLTPLVSGLFFGLSFVAFQELVAKTIPAERLSSMWAVRTLVGALVGAAAGRAVSHILERWPGAEGFGILHICAFVFLVVSYAIFSISRETTLPPKRADGRGNWKDFVRSVPGLVRADRQFRLYLLSRAFLAGAFIVIPFLSVHALRMLGKPDSYLGHLLIYQMVGVVLGNVIAALLGDRYGGRLVLLAGTVCYVGLCLWTAAAGTEWDFAGLFFLLGTAASLERVGAPALGFTIAPVGKRVAYLALMATVTIISVVCITGLSVLLHAVVDNLLPIAVIAGLFVAASLWCVLLMHEPRTLRGT